MKKTILLMVFGLISAISIIANDPPENPVEPYEWFKDEVEKLIYIDFEQISVSLDEVIIKDNQDNTIQTYSVRKLSVNTIFELDFSDMKQGVYKVELHSATKVYLKELVLE